jgi:hypothetical protein
MRTRDCTEEGFECAILGFDLAHAHFMSLLTNAAGIDGNQRNLLLARGMRAKQHQCTSPHRVFMRKCRVSGERQKMTYASTLLRLENARKPPAGRKSDENVYTAGLLPRNACLHMCIHLDS